MDKKKLTLEEKVDLIITYQKSARRWAIAGGIFKLFLFFALVVLPIVLTIKYFDDFKKSETYQNLQNTAGQAAQMQQINELLKQLPQR